MSANTISAEQLIPLFQGATWATLVWHSHNGGFYLTTDKGQIKAPGGKRGRGDDVAYTIGHYQDGDFPRTAEERASDERMFDQLKKTLDHPGLGAVVFNVGGFKFLRKGC